MANGADEIGDRTWLTLGLARTLLGINEATLRQWADHGLVRAFRTPGGHRRFSAEDIDALIAEGQPEAAAGMHVPGGAVALPRIRRRVKGSTRPNTPAWMERFDLEGLELMRGLGREFLDLCTAHIEQPSRPGALDEAAELGRKYSREIASRGVLLCDALEAFIFFRNATIEAIRPAFGKRGATPGQVSTALEHLNRLTDRVLMSLATCYRQEPLPLAQAAGKGS